MAENTAIEWCDHTFNPWIGCTKTSPACDHCYAERDTPVRILRGKGVETFGPQAIRHRTGKDNWRKPMQWQAKAAEFQALHGRRQRVFCASLADVFDNKVPDQWRDDLWTLIDYTRDLDWLLLTKRIGNVGNMLPLPFDFAEKFPHVWIGATICNQAEADRDIPKLLNVDARVRFLSIEPMLGPIDLTGEWLTAKLGAYPFRTLPPEHRTKLIELLDWVIVGGESGPGARPMHPDWARSLRDQCALAGVPFLFKQWGEWSPGYAENGNDLDYGDIVEAKQHEWPEGHCSFRVGKKVSGRTLDGIEHNGVPGGLTRNFKDKE